MNLVIPDTQRINTSNDHRCSVVEKYFGVPFPNSEWLWVMQITWAVSRVVAASFSAWTPQTPSVARQWLEAMNNEWFSLDFTQSINEQRVEIERMANLLNCFLAMGSTSLVRGHFPLLKRIAEKMYSEVTSYVMRFEDLDTARRESRLWVPAFMNNLAQFCWIDGDPASMYDYLRKSVELWKILWSRQYIFDAEYTANSCIPDGFITSDTIEALKIRSQGGIRFSQALTVIYSDNEKIDLDTAWAWWAESNPSYINNPTLFADHRERYIRSQRTKYQADLVSIFYEFHGTLLSPNLSPQSVSVFESLLARFEALRAQYVLSFWQEEWWVGTPNYTGTFEARSGELIMKMELLLSKIACSNPSLIAACRGLTQYTTADFWTIWQESAVAQWKTVLFQKWLRWIDMMWIYVAAIKNLLDVNGSNSSAVNQADLINTRTELYYRIARDMVSSILARDGIRVSIEQYLIRRWKEPSMEILEWSLLAMGTPNNQFSIRDVLVTALNKQKDRFFLELLSGFLGSREWGIYVTTADIAIPVSTSKTGLSIDAQDIYHTVDLSEWIKLYIAKFSAEESLPQGIASLFRADTITCIVETLREEIQEAKNQGSAIHTQMLMTTNGVFSNKVLMLELAIQELHKGIRTFYKECRDFFIQISRFAPDTEHRDYNYWPLDRVTFLQLLGRVQEGLDKLRNRK